MHTRNFGYGANQKTCYAEALKEGADIVVMLHPDYQYDPTLLPEVIAPIKAGEADIVLGSRFLAGNTIRQRCTLVEIPGKQVSDPNRKLDAGIESGRISHGLPGVQPEERSRKFHSR